MMSAQTTSTATVGTNRAARYGQQLVSHLGRRCAGKWDETTDSGTLEMGEGAARVALNSRPHALVITVDAPRLPTMKTSSRGIWNVSASATNYR